MIHNEDGILVSQTIDTNNDGTIDRTWQYFNDANGLPKESKLIEKGHGCPKSIQAIEIMARNASGRITSLRIQGKDASLEISAKDFRQALDPNVIRSTNFTIKVVSGTAYIEGLGWGHGVGLCQWGMYAMAKEGYTYTQILSHYFPGSQIGKAE